jgi:hypothetical protein
MVVGRFLEPLIRRLPLPIPILVSYFGNIAEDWIPPGSIMWTSLLIQAATFTIPGLEKKICIGQIQFKMHKTMFGFNIRPAAFTESGKLYASSQDIYLAAPRIRMDQEVPPRPSYLYAKITSSATSSSDEIRQRQINQRLAICRLFMAEVYGRVIPEKDRGSILDKVLDKFVSRRSSKQCSQSSSQRLDGDWLNVAWLFNPAAWLDDAWLNEAGLYIV